MTETEIEPGSDHPLWLQTVTLLIETVGMFGGRTNPVGSTGTVVTVFKDGVAFQVEVDGDLVEVQAGEIMLLPPTAL